MFKIHFLFSVRHFGKFPRLFLFSTRLFISIEQTMNQTNFEHFILIFFRTEVLKDFHPKNVFELVSQSAVWLCLSEVNSLRYSRYSVMCSMTLFITFPPVNVSQEFFLLLSRSTRSRCTWFYTMYWFTWPQVNDFLFYIKHMMFKNRNGLCCSVPFWLFNLCIKR